jgi:hypothetical protein
VEPHALAKPGGAASRNTARQRSKSIMRARLSQGSEQNVFLSCLRAPSNEGAVPRPPSSSTCGTGKQRNIAYVRHRSSPEGQVVSGWRSCWCQLVSVLPSKLSSSFSGLLNVAPASVLGIFAWVALRQATWKLPSALCHADADDTFWPQHEFRTPSAWTIISTSLDRRSVWPQLEFRDALHMRCSRCQLLFSVVSSVVTTNDFGIYGMDDEC